MGADRPFPGLYRRIFYSPSSFPDVEFSERENRYLHSCRISVSRLFFPQDTSELNYTTDQFALRDSWTTLKARSEMAAEKKKQWHLPLPFGLFLREDTL
jgi:hypothetical protein